MQFFTYEIRSQVLRPYLQFILFNYCNDEKSSHALTYYPNHDICLGIIKGKSMVAGKNGFTLQPTGRCINAYLTGMYTKPHQLQVNGSFDEICLPFTPLGYHHFFRIPLQTYLLEEELLREAFGQAGELYFEAVFEEKNFSRRGQMIESFLRDKLVAFENSFIAEALDHMHQRQEGNLKTLLQELQCSEKKLQRSFLRHFDILPKDYLQILRFRKALHLINMQDDEALTGI